jgi:hypothetical protein
VYPSRRRWALDAARCARGLSESTRPRRAASRPVASREAKRAAGPARIRTCRARSLEGALEAAPAAGGGSLRQPPPPGEGRGQAEAATSVRSRARHSTQSLPALRREPAGRPAAAGQPWWGSRPGLDRARAEAQQMRRAIQALRRPPGQPVPPQEPPQARETPVRRKPRELGRPERGGQDSKATALPARAAPRAPGPVPWPQPEAALEQDPAARAVRPARSEAPAWPEAGRADRRSLERQPCGGYRGRRTARRRRAHRLVQQCRPRSLRRRPPSARPRSSRDGRE